MTMMPRALTRWEKQLSLLPDSGTDVLGPWLPRLASMVGAEITTRRKRYGEPDGFDGLSRRGIYDRLVQSEWLLLDVIPEEFERRAVMNEHLFLQPAGRIPRGARHTVVLFDAGPDQLGAPRLAHLALLIVLARRAEAEKALFSFGVIQKPGQLYDGMNRTDLERLIAARSWQRPSSADYETWQECLDTLPPEDLYVVGTRFDNGDDNGESLLQQTVRVFVEQPFAPDEPHLTVHVESSRGAVGKQLRLMLPPMPEAVRLLRASAYRPAPKAKLRDAPVALGSFQFSSDGRRLLVFDDAEHRITGMHVPNSVKEPQGRDRVLPLSADEQLLAADYRGQRWWMVSLRGDDIHVRGAGGDGIHGPFRNVSGCAVFDGTHFSPLVPRCCIKEGNGDTARHLVFRDGQDRLVGLNQDGPVWSREIFSAAPVTAYFTSLVVLERYVDRAAMLYDTCRGPFREHPFDFSGDGTFEMVSAPSLGIFAVNDKENRWPFFAVDSGELPYTIHVPTGWKVLGVTATDRRPAFLCLDAEQGAIFRLTSKRREVVRREPDGIVATQYHGVRQLLAYRTQCDELVVYSAQHGASLLRVKGETS